MSLTPFPFLFIVFNGQSELGYRDVAAEKERERERERERAREREISPPEVCHTNPFGQKLQLN